MSFLTRLENSSNAVQPLNLVKEQVKLERSTSQKLAASSARQAPPSAARAAPAPAIDLIGGDEPPARPRTGPPVTRQPPPKAEAAPPKATKPADSLLGLDFFAPSQSAPPARPSSTSAGGTSGPSRPDLKQSILSLYASAPKPTPQAQPQTAQSTNILGMQSLSMQSPPAQNSGFGGLNDAFSGLSFGSPAAQQPSKPSPFAGLDTMAKPPTVAKHTSKTSFGGGGSFFDSPKSPIKQAPPQPAPAQRTFSASSGFGDFFSSTSPVAAAPPTTSTTKTHSNDLFDLGLDAPISPPPAKPTAPVATPAAAPVAAPSISSAFNLSIPQPPSQPSLANKPAPATSSLVGLSNNFDAWGSSDVWGSESNVQPVKSPPAATATSSFGWGTGGSGLTPAATKIASPKISGDEDFGGWSSAPHTHAAHQPASSTSTATKPVAFNNSDDLFSNVWE
jgi:stromal membrane-associated protein